jgi:hypothetical protein
MGRSISVLTQRWTTSTLRLGPLLRGSFALLDAPVVLPAVTLPGRSGLAGLLPEVPDAGAVGNDAPGRDAGEALEAGPVGDPEPDALVAEPLACSTSTLNMSTASCGGRASFSGTSEETGSESKGRNNAKSIFPAGLSIGVTVSADRERRSRRVKRPPISFRLRRLLPMRGDHQMLTTPP